MHLNIWDQEYNSLNQKVLQISEGFSDNSGAKYRNLVRKDIVVRKLETFLNNINLRFKRTSEASLSGTTRSRALIYWARQLSSQCSHLLERYDSYLKQYMWIRLFKIRFLNKHDDDKSYLLNDEDLALLEESQRTQKNLEIYLTEQNRKLISAEQELRQTYDELTTEEENYVAGRSMQHLWGTGAK